MIYRRHFVTQSWVHLEVLQIDNYGIHDAYTRTMHHMSTVECALLNLCMPFGANGAMELAIVTVPATVAAERHWSRAYSLSPNLVPSLVSQPMIVQVLRRC